MPNSASAKKRVRQNVSRRAINNWRKRRIKDQTKAFLAAVADQDVHTAETEFRKTMSYGDVVEIAMESRRVRNTCVTFGFTVYRAGTPEVYARSEHTVVCVDMDTFRPTAIPSRCRDAFESIAAPAGD